MRNVGFAAVTALALAFALFALLVVVASVSRPQEPGSGEPGVVCAPPGAGPGVAVAGFGGDQLANAAAIVAAGDELRVPQRGQVIAVATAMQESGLRNLPYGDRDSVGLFQQRGPWGSTAVRMNPKASAALFYQHLLAVPGWASMPLTVAAQTVQVSAFPDAYAQWTAKAEQVVGSVLGIVCSPAGGGGGAELAPDPLAATVLSRALAQVGMPYAWGGGSAGGPSNGISDGGGAADAAGDSHKVGFDCSGLMVYAFAGIGVTLPHQTQAIWSGFGPPITDRSQIQPGDMIMLSSNGTPGGVDHVGLYLGAGRAIDAPESGSAVRVEPNIWANPYWSSHFLGAIRPHPAVASPGKD